MYKIQLCAIVLATTVGALAAPVQFTEHLVATDIRGGYQVVAADLNKDGKVDLIGLGSQASELVWFENPTWERHVITNSAPHMINMDVADIDGDGIPEIGLTYDFSARPSQGQGKIVILTHNGDPRGIWTSKDIDAVPTTHRVRFADIDGNGRKVLVIQPIINSKATGFPDPDRLPTPLLIYRPGTWKRETVTEENYGVVHGLLAWDWNGDRREELFTAGRLGIHSHSLGKDGKWTRTQITKGEDKPYPDGGSSDLSPGMMNKKKFFAAIEPFHGNTVAVYQQDAKGEWQRNVIETELDHGHSIVVVDVDGDGNSEIVAGGTSGAKKLNFYKATDATGHSWQRSTLDDAMSANSCVAADINGDKKMDVACIDNTMPFDLKWYQFSGPADVKALPLRTLL
jgi:FG-GAP-like repeat